MKAVDGEKGAQGIRPYLTIDVVTNDSPLRWEMVVGCVSTSILVLQLNVAVVHNFTYLIYQLQLTEFHLVCRRR